ncbi:MAG: hypothetical protein GYA48_14400 [Chloroflexi bacterium]|nr:hypothetical protein [Chloroflexota bacterium]
MLQMVAVSRLRLIGGSADLVLMVLIAWGMQEQVKDLWVWVVVASLMTSFVSALPVFAVVAGYLFAAVLIWFLKQQVWQSPILAMFFATAVATLVQNLAAIFALQISGSPITFTEGFNLVIVPSMLLNFLLVLPLYALFTDLAGFVYPVEEVV